MLQGGIVSAVCHGPACLPGMKGSDGEALIKGKKVTGFSEVGMLLCQPETWTGKNR